MALWPSLLPLVNFTIRQPLCLTSCSTTLTDWLPSQPPDQNPRSDFGETAARRSFCLYPWSGLAQNDNALRGEPHKGIPFGYEVAGLKLFLDPAEVLAGVCRVFVEHATGE